MSAFISAGDNGPASRRRRATPSINARFAGVCVVLTGLVVAFGYCGGWLSPDLMTPARYVDRFQQTYGDHPGFRRNHAKGVCVTGHFESNGAGSRLSKAEVFEPGRVPVIGRFSLGGGQPHISDSPSAARGCGLQFSSPNGEVWRTAMVNLPVFPFPTPEAFFEQLAASVPDPHTKKPNPAAMKAFFDRHPESVRAMGVIHSTPPSSGFQDSAYYGLNAFFFTNDAGTTVPVRWMLEPDQKSSPAGEVSAVGDENYMFDALIKAVQRGPLRWRLILIVGEPGDSTKDSSIAWPADRERVDAGSVTIDEIASDDDSPDVRDITFDPLVLPAGIAPSDDPLLSARSAVYSRSFTRRAGEPIPSSPVTPAEVARDK